VKVPPGVFIEKLPVPSIKQSGAITPELLAPTFKASIGSNMEDDKNSNPNATAQPKTTQK
jgi:hypothetical protein